MSGFQVLESSGWGQCRHKRNGVAVRCHDPQARLRTGFIRELQIKTAVRYHLKPTGLTVTEKGQ